MAKNLKLNIKNSQLAGVLKLTKEKKTSPAVDAEKKKIEATPLPEESPPIDQEVMQMSLPSVIEESPSSEPEEPPIEPSLPKTAPRAEETSPPPQRDYRSYPSRPRSFEPRSGNSNYSSETSARPASGFHAPNQPHRRPILSDRQPPGSSVYRPPGGPSYRSGTPGGQPFTPRHPPATGLLNQKPLLPKSPSTFEPKKVGAKDYRDVKPLKKQSQAKAFDSRDRQGLTDTENEAWRKRRSMIRAKSFINEDISRPKELAVRLPISVKDLAVAMKLKASQLISRLFMQGIVLTLNDILDDQTVVQLLGHDFDCNIQIDTSEEEKLRITDKTIRQEIQETNPSLLQKRAPVVAFMGHVDHGKTSLIDYIRKSNRVSMEAGAITQHMGAFLCHTPVGDITILDTPGHEAFSSMRARGADVTDIVVLVIAGDEGVKAQTIEAMQQAKDANVPVLVVINKCDVAGFDPENVYRQLAEHQLLPEKWGGTTITVNCSATTGVGVDDLLEMLALQAEVLELLAAPNLRARGTVIESEMHKGLGAQATVLVQNGSLRAGDAVVFAQHWGRVKTMHDAQGKEVTVAGPSTPVKITGLSGLPAAGSEFIVVKSEREARQLGEARTLGQKNLLFQQAKRTTVETFLQNKAEKIQKKVLNVILRADVQGSLEAIRNSLMKIESDKVELQIVSAEVGEISESDIRLAAASKAVVLGFHTKIENHAELLINELKIHVSLHDIIYHAVDYVKKLMLDLLDKIPQEYDTGTAEVKAIFKASQLGVIAGCQVTQGTLRRNQQVRLLRKGEQIWKGPIASLKRVKEDIREVAKGMECGILLQGFNQIEEGDLIQGFDIQYLTPIL